jgi:hypothetical protein
LRGKKNEPPNHRPAVPDEAPASNRNVRTSTQTHARRADMFSKHRKILPGEGSNIDKNKKLNEWSCVNVQGIFCCVFHNPLLLFVSSCTSSNTRQRISSMRDRRGPEGKRVGKHGSSSAASIGGHRFEAKLLQYPLYSMEIVV